MHYFGLVILYDSDADVFQFQSGGNLVIKKIDGTNTWE